MAGVSKVLDRIPQLGYPSEQLTPMSTFQSTGGRQVVPLSSQEGNHRENEGTPTPRPIKTRKVKVKKAYLGQAIGTLEFTEEDVEYSPNTPSFDKNIDGFLDEWVASEKIKVKGYGIPVKYWKNVFARHISKT